MLEMLERERERSMLEMLEREIYICSKCERERERERCMVEMLERERELYARNVLSTFSLLSVSENKTSGPAGVRSRVYSFAFAWKLLDLPLSTQ